jgi:hypothetical protein
LLGDERTVGEVLLVGRAVGIDGERHTHLSGRYGQALEREDAGIGVEHLDLSLVRQIYFGFIGHAGQDVARQADAGVAYLEASGIHARLIFVFGADGSVHFGQVVLAFQFFLIDFLSVFVDGFFLSLSSQWQQGHEQEQDVLLHCFLLSVGFRRQSSETCVMSVCHTCFICVTVSGFCRQVAGACRMS